MSASERYRPRHSRAEVLFADGVWVPCTILAWAKSQAGWAALVRWRNGGEDWLVYHPDHLQPVLLWRAFVRCVCHVAGLTGQRWLLLAGRASAQGIQTRRSHPRQRSLLPHAPVG